MLFLIHLLIFSLLPCLSTSSYDYGIIRNASINATAIVHFNFTGRTCDDCLCHAFKNYDKVNLFTCTQNVSDSICKFYNPTPTRDKIENSSSHTSIYLIKNETFKDDCCNTTFLAAMINNKSAQYMGSADLRSLIVGDHDTLVTNTFNSVIKFNKSTFEFINETSFSFRIYSIGYWDNKYYLGIDDNILIYDETLTTLMLTVLITDKVMTIRFLNGTYMIVGANEYGVRIYEKDENGNFTKNVIDLELDVKKQLHAISIVNESAFYIGWESPGRRLILYTRDKTNSWVSSAADTIPHNERARDVVFDDQCNRIWVVEPITNKIWIYHQNKLISTIDISGVLKKLFNLLILDKSTYTLAISTNAGLLHLQPDINCRI